MNNQWSIDNIAQPKIIMKKYAMQTEIYLRSTLYMRIMPPPNYDKIAMKRIDISTIQPKTHTKKESNILEFSFWLQIRIKCFMRCD